MTNPKSLPDAVERVTLLPCPFCGEAAKLCRDTDRHKNDGEWDVACIGCGAEIRKESTPESAARQWNTRAAEAQLDKLETEKARYYEQLTRSITAHELAERKVFFLLDAVEAREAHRDTEFHARRAAEAKAASLLGEVERLKAKIEINDHNHAVMRDIYDKERDQLSARLEAVLARDAEWSPSGSKTGCNCINLSHKAEQEYETGKCPHQLARQALQAPDTDKTGDAS